jgi:hypothetical protein
LQTTRSFSTLFDNGLESVIAQKRYFPLAGLRAQSATLQSTEHLLHKRPATTQSTKLTFSSFQPFETSRGAMDSKKTAIVRPINKRKSKSAKLPPPNSSEAIPRSEQKASSEIHRIPSQG